MNLFPTVSDKRLLPNFICIGAEKAGTTALYDYLKVHPEIYMSPIKETHFFSTDVRVENFRDDYRQHERQKRFNINAYFSKPRLEEFWEAYITNPEHYLRLFADGTSYKARGEVCNSYLYSAEAIVNIADSIPDIKILVLLRNPVDRAFSQYRAMVRDGRAEKGNLIDEVLFDMQTEDRRWGSCHGYIDHGLYSGQLKRAFSVVPQERIKVLFAEDFFQSTQQCLDDIFAYLGVARIPLDKMVRNRNRSVVPRSPLAARIAVRSGVKSLIGSVLPQSVKQWLKSVFFEDAKIVMSRNERTYLLNLLNDDIEKTSVLLHRDLRHWTLPSGARQVHT